ncbi:rRNA-processing endoribonuclease [Geranomyces variabilis]|nr:rRNA-processing endoribonuclease [Geranomyces variabilis]
MPAATSSLSFWGAKGIRRRLTLALLTRRNITISGIRTAEEDLHIGITEDEMSLVDLFRQLCPAAEISVTKGGTEIVVSRQGTGSAVPGGSFSHVCPSVRSIAWFAECVLLVGSVAAAPLCVRFTGPATDLAGHSIDTLNAVNIPLLKEFGVSASIDIVQRTAVRALAGGLVSIKVTPPRQVTAANLSTTGAISRVRGVAYSTGLDATLVTLAAEAAETLLRRTVPDTEVEILAMDQGHTTDKGYGMTLVASAAPHMNFAASCTFCPRGDKDTFAFPSPENLGVRAGRLLLQQLVKHGSVSTATTPFVLTLLALARRSGHAGAVRLGSLDGETVQVLRDIKAFFVLEFDLQHDHKSKTVVLTPL